MNRLEPMSARRVDRTAVAHDCIHYVQQQTACHACVLDMGDVACIVLSALRYLQK